MTPHALPPSLIAGLLVFAVYRRIRRNFGRQRLRMTRMMLRVVIFAAVGLLGLVAAIAVPRVLGAGVAGIAAGALLGAWGVRLTRFERDAGGTWYTPNAWLGVGVTALFLARLVYRLVVLYPAWTALGAAQAPGDAAPRAPLLPAVLHGPLTFALFGLLVGYYVAYYAGLIETSRQHATDAP